MTRAHKMRDIQMPMCGKRVERSFRDITIPRFDKDETRQILEQGFGKVGKTFDDEVMDEAFALSGGFPEPIHILGSEMLSVDTDGNLTLDDLKAAKIKVVKDVRRNSLHALLGYAGSGKYQHILRAMASSANQYVPLEHISQETGYQQNEYSANMGKLIERNVITKVARGKYMFVDPLLKEYIREFGVIDVDEEGTFSEGADDEGTS